MSQYIVRYEGFARRPAVCHVVVARDGADRLAVLVGELDDNPGTSTINAIENVASLISTKLLAGREDFSLYQYTLGMPDSNGPRDRFLRVTWNGGRAFTMPTWDTVDPDSDPWLRHIKGTVRPDDYTAKALMAEPERHLKFVDGVADELPWAS